MTDLIVHPAIEAETQSIVTAKLAKMDTAELRQELARALTVTADTLAYLASVWRELEARGEDLSDMRAGLGRYLPMIAAGQLDAEAVVAFAGQQVVLNAVATLPIDRQRDLAQGAAVRVLSVDDDGRAIEAEIPATMLTRQQVSLAFDRGRIRTVAEQRNMISSARVAAARKRPGTGRTFHPRIDTLANVMHIGRATIPLPEVLEALVSAGVIPADALLTDAAPDVEVGQ